MSWKVVADMGYGGAPYQNRFRFATKEEAEDYGNKFARGAKSFEVVQVREPFTHKIVGNSLESV